MPGLWSSKKAGLLIARFCFFGFFHCRKVLLARLVKTFQFLDDVVDALYASHELCLVPLGKSPFDDIAGLYVLQKGRYAVFVHDKLRHLVETDPSARQYLVFA